MSDKEEKQAQAKKRNWSRLKSRINANNIVALSALFISVCALVVSIIEMRTMPVQQSAMVYPHLDFGQSYNSEGFELYAKNTGTGLAIIKSVEVMFDGESFKDWLQLIDHLLPEGHTLGYNVIKVNQINGKVIPAGEMVTVFGINWSDEARVLEERMRGIQYKICYCSILEECWEITDQESFPQSTDPCPFNKEVIF